MSVELPYLVKMGSKTAAFSELYDALYFVRTSHLNENLRIESSDGVLLATRPRFTGALTRPRRRRHGTPDLRLVESQHIDGDDVVDEVDGFELFEAMMDGEDFDD